MSLSNLCEGCWFLKNYIQGVLVVVVQKGHSGVLFFLLCDLNEAEFDHEFLESFEFIFPFLDFALEFVVFLLMFSFILLA